MGVCAVRASQHVLNVWGIYVYMYVVVGSCVVKACYSAVLLCGTVQCMFVVTKYVRTYIRRLRL